MVRVRHISRLLPDDELSDSDSDIPWSLPDELFIIKDDDSDRPPPIVTFSRRTERELRRLFPGRLPAQDVHVDSPAVGSPTCTRNIEEVCSPRTRYRKSPRDADPGITDSAQRPIGRASGCSPADSTRSVSRPLLAEHLPQQSMMGSALGSVRKVVKTGIRSSFNTLSAIPRTGTMRRCWGALKEALDDLGDVWDAHEDDNSEKEASSPDFRRVRSVSTRVTPARHDPEEFVTPPTRPELGSGKSHYNTLTSSPIAASRSSKRVRKLRLRHKSPTPVRRKHGFDIDHSFSTDDESSDPHSRLENRIFSQDAPHLYQDNFYVFMYQQESLKCSTGPLAENKRPEVNEEQVDTRSDHTDEISPGRSRAPVAEALQSPPVGPARESVSDLVTGRCQHGVPFGEHVCRSWQDTDSNFVRSPVASATFSAEEPQQDADTGSMIRSLNREHRSSNNLLTGSSEATGPNNEQSSENTSNDRRVPTPDHLRSDVQAIFHGHANGNTAVNRQRRHPSSSLRRRFAEGLKEALRPRHPDFHQDYMPTAKSSTQPQTNSSFHMSDDGTVHQVVEHPPTRSSIFLDPEYQLTDENRDLLPRATHHVNDWLRDATPQGNISGDGTGHHMNDLLDHATPQTSNMIPSIDVLEGTTLSGTHQTQTQPPSYETIEADVPRQRRKLRHRLREHENCIVLSAAVPPERDTTDLLMTPFMTFHHEPPVELPRSTRASPEGALMSTFGIDCNSVPAPHDALGSFSCADHAMIQSAAMGSTSILTRIDTDTINKLAATSRVKQANANANNTSWHDLDDARKFVGPPLSVKYPRNSSEGRAAYIYNLHNIYQGIQSRWPMLAISIWMKMEQGTRRFERNIKRAYLAWNKRWLPHVYNLPPPDPVDCLTEAYILVNSNIFKDQAELRVKSLVNGFAAMLVFERLPALHEARIRELIEHRALAFVQLSVTRCRALRMCTWFVEHPEIAVDKELRWEDVGFDWVPKKVANVRSQAPRRSPVPSYEPNLAITRVRSTVDETDGSLQQRRLLLPHPRHLPSPADIPVAVTAPEVPLSPTPRKPSRLREVVQAQEDERLTELHDGFEEFKKTGKRPERKSAEGAPPTKRNRSSELSSYRPYSLPSTSSRTQADTDSAGGGPPNLSSSSARRLGSTELFPDRYTAQKITAAPGNIPEGPRVSVANSTGIGARDFAYSQATTFVQSEQVETSKAAAPSDSDRSSHSSPRRSAARSDSSEISSVSSTESSRARKALAVKLNQDKSRVELNSGKSTASVGFTSTAGNLFRDVVNVFTPSNSKRSAEDVTRRLSKSPIRHESGPGQAGGSESNPGEAVEGSRPASPSSKRRRENFVPLLPWKKQQKQRQVESDDAPTAEMSKLGILPEPDEDSAQQSSKEGTIEGDHGNPLPEFSYPTESPPPKTSLPPPPNLSEGAQLIWIDQDSRELHQRHSDWQDQRSSNIEPEATPPPTPRLRETLPDLPTRYALAMSESDTLEKLLAAARSIAGREYEHTPSRRTRGRERRRQSPSESANKPITASSASDSGQQQTESTLGPKRRSRSQDDKRLFERTTGNNRSPNSREREHAQGEDGGVSLKPLTPIHSSSSPSPSSPSERPFQRSGITRRRAISIVKVAVAQANQQCKEEMTDDPIIRGYAVGSQEDLYAGFGIHDMAHSPMLRRYAEPNRDTDEINRSIYNMTVNDHDYRVGGPSSPVDIYNIDYHSDVSEIRGRADFEHAREAKAFAGYAMFTERQEEIDMLHDMKERGCFKEDIDIKYGYQEMGPHGSIAWLTHEGQKIGGRQREEYEREKAVEESRKQAQAEIEYYQLYDPEKIEQLEKRHDSKVDPLQPNDTASNPVQHSVDHTPRSASPAKDSSTLIARTVIKRRGSDDSVKTVYGADEEIPNSAYRSQPAPRSDI